MLHAGCPAAAAIPLGNKETAARQATPAPTAGTPVIQPNRRAPANRVRAARRYDRDGRIACRLYPSNFTSRAA
jgi:hypothetical protein